MSSLVDKLYEQIVQIDKQKNAWRVCADKLARAIGRRLMYDETEEMVEVEWAALREYNALANPEPETKAV